MAYEDAIRPSRPQSNATSAGRISKTYADPASRCHTLRSWFCVAPRTLRYAKLRLGCCATFAQDDTRGILNLLLRNVTIKNRLLGIDKFPALVYNNHVRRHSLVVKPQLPKLMLRVRFPLPAPKRARGVHSTPLALFRQDSPNQNPTMWRNTTHGYICAGYHNSFRGYQRKYGF